MQHTEQRPLKLKGQSDCKTNKVKPPKEGKRLSGLNSLCLTNEAEYRAKALMEAGFNTALIKKKQILVDTLPQAGFSNPSLLQPDDKNQISDGQSAFTRFSQTQSFKSLSKAVYQIFGHAYLLPTQQNHGTEKIYIPALLKRCRARQKSRHSPMTAISNHFGHVAHAYLNYSPCHVRNIQSSEALDTERKLNFKGNFDIALLEKTIMGCGAKNIPFISCSMGCGFNGGQPMSMENLKAVYQLAKKHKIPVLIDAQHFSENAFFIKQREKKYNTLTIWEIVKEQAKYADLLALPAKEDGLVPQFGLLCFKNNDYLPLYWECQYHNYFNEQAYAFDQFEGGAFERLTQTLYEKLQEPTLYQRYSQVENLVTHLEESGVPCQQASGYAAFIDARRLLPHLPLHQFPAQALACALYKETGIRSVAFDSFLLGRHPLTKEKIITQAAFLPIPVYAGFLNGSYLSMVNEALKRIKSNSQLIKGLIPTYEPIGFYQNHGRFKEVSHG